MKDFLIYLWERMKEPSSWAGLAALMGTFATNLPSGYEGEAKYFLMAAAYAGAMAITLKEQSKP